MLKYLKMRFGFIRGKGVHMIGNITIDVTTVIGDYCTLLAGVGGSITIKASVSIGRDAWIAAGDGEIDIGEECLMGPRVTIVAQNHATVDLSEQSYLPWDRDGAPSKTIIGRRCHIGAGAVILPGSVIGDYSQIAANAVVAGKFDQGALIFGYPAKTIIRSKIPSGLPDEPFKGLQPFQHTSRRFY